MLIFLYGEDEFSSSRKLKEIKEKFEAKNPGGVNLSVIDFEDKENEIGFERLSSDLLSLPFLTSSRLVIIKNMLKKGRKETFEKFEELLENIPKSTIALFLEKGGLRKNSKLFKKLCLLSKNKEFKKKEGFALISWIKEETKKQGGTIETEAAGMLALRTASDMFRISSEIKKLASYKKGRLITKEDVSKMVNDSSESQIFSLIDALAERNLKSAMAELYRLKKKEHELYIFKMIIFGFRNLLIVSDYLKKGERNSNKMAKDLKIHPFVARKTLSASKNFDFQELLKIYHKLLEIDLDVKSGKRDAKRELDVLVYRLCR